MERRQPKAYTHNQEQQYYGYQTKANTMKNTARLSRYDHNSSRNIPEIDSSKEIGSTQKGYNGSRRISKTRSQHGRSPNNTFYSNSNINQRIEKACTTNSTADLKKQNYLLKKQIDRLEKQLLKKDKTILSSKNAVMPTKQNQGEIMELYRVVHFYEGKVKEMEAEIEKFRDIILKIDPNQGIKQQQINMIFHELTDQNQQIQGRLQYLEFQKNNIQSKYKRLQSKYYQNHRELGEYKRKQIDPLNKNNTERANYMYQLLKNQTDLQGKQSFYNLQALSQQNKQLQNMLQKNKSQNQILKIELQEKNNQITQMHKQYVTIKRSYKSLKSINNQQNPAQNSQKSMNVQKLVLRAM